MGSDHFDRESWPLPPLAIELDDLAISTQGNPRRSVTDAAIEWACSQLLDGVSPRDVCEAAMWLGLRRTRTEGRGVPGHLSHSVVAAASCSSIGDGLTTNLAVVQHVVHALNTSGGTNDPREGGRLLPWIDPVAVGTDRPTDAAEASTAQPAGGSTEQDGPCHSTVSAADRLVDAAMAGECELADCYWLLAAYDDPDEAFDALISAALAGYHLNEHKLILPAQLRAWTGGAGVDPVLLRAAARFAGNHQQDWVRSACIRRDAAELAHEAMHHGCAPDAAAPGDHQHLSTVATGLLQAGRAELPQLVVTSLRGGLAPVDLVRAVSLATAARYSATSFADSAPIAAIHACTGANAVRRCLDLVQSPEALYELALCAPTSPHAADLDTIAELWVPPADSGGLEDLLVAIDDADPDAAAEAATAVDCDDEDAVRIAWAAVHAAAVRDDQMLLHAIKHTQSMYDEFVSCTHPARVWFLSAAARTAGHANRGTGTVAERATALLG